MFFFLLYSCCPCFYPMHPCFRQPVGPECINGPDQPHLHPHSLPMGLWLHLSSDLSFRSLLELCCRNACQYLEQAMPVPGNGPCFCGPWPVDSVLVLTLDVPCHCGLAWWWLDCVWPWPDFPAWLQTCPISVDLPDDVDSADQLKLAAISMSALLASLRYCRAGCWLARAWHCWPCYHAWCLAPWPGGSSWSWMVPDKSLCRRCPISKGTILNN